MSFLLNIEPNCYGLKHDGSSIMIGKVPVQIKRDVLHIKANKFHLTKGLIELLTKWQPQDFNGEDIQSYKRILILTNAHMRKYGNVYRIKPNSSWKYQNIISKLFPSKRKRRSVKMCEEEEEYPTENMQVLPKGKYVSSTKYKADKEMENSMTPSPSELHATNSKYNIKFDNTTSKMINNGVIEWDSDTDPNDIVAAIKINKRLGTNYDLYIHTLRDMGIIE